MQLLKGFTGAEATNTQDELIWPGGDVMASAQATRRALRCVGTALETAQDSRTDYERA